MKFKLGEKTYTSVTLTKPSIMDYIKLGNQTAALGQRWTDVDVRNLANRIAECKTNKERMDHPEMLMFIGLLQWAALAVDGDPDPFEKGFGVSLEDLEFIPEPGDDAKGPQDHKDPSKPRAPRASVRGAKRPVAKRAAAKTSKTRSTPAS
jgi:hypothetical protein